MQQTTRHRRRSTALRPSGASSSFYADDGVWHIDFKDARTIEMAKAVSVH